MVRQQIMGIINLSLPLIILYNLQPYFITSLPGHIFCAVFVSLYITYCAYQQLVKLETSLQYSPSGFHKIFFEDLMRSCGVDSRNIIVRYAYTNEMIAMTAGKTVIVDPIVWHDVHDDEQAVQVYNIFKHHIEPVVLPQVKMRLAAIKELLTPQAQRFIFKHELAHVIYNFSYKKLWIVFFIGFIAAYIGIFAAQCVLSFHPLLAIFVGMFVGGVFDLLLTYLSNFMWKLQEEKKADAFAVQHSNLEDVQAAVAFFEQHQRILDEYKEKSFLSLPIFAGYQDGYTRAAYLLNLLARQKK